MSTIIIALILQFAFFYTYGIYSFITRSGYKREGEESGVNIKKINKKLQRPSPAASQTNIPSLHTSLDDANLLLYLGAFLIVVAALIFVGYSYEYMSASVKILLLTAFSIGFYVAGLYAYFFYKRVRPAALTFISIGMIMIPFIGLAYDTFVLERAQEPIVWMVTSIVAVGVYGYTTRLLKSAHVSYLTLFATVSLYASVISIIDMPLYYFGWALSTVGMLYMWIARKKVLAVYTQEPMEVSSILMGTASFFLTIVLFSMNDKWQAGVNMFLIAGQIVLAAELYGKNKTTLIHLAQACIGAGVMIFGSYWELGNGRMGVLLLAVASMWTAFVHFFRDRDWALPYVSSMRLAISAYTIVAIFFAIKTPLDIKILLGAMGINAYMYALDRSLRSWAILWFASLLLPYMLFVDGVWMKLDDHIVTHTYLALATLILAVRYGLTKRLAVPEIQTLQLAYLISIFISFLSFILGYKQPEWIFLLYSIFTMLVAFVEGTPELLGVAAAFLYASTYYLMENVVNVSRSMRPLGFSLVGTSLYVMAQMFLKTYSKWILIISGITGLFLGVVLPGVWIGSIPIIFITMYAGAFLLALESFLRRSAPIVKVAGAIFALVTLGFMFYHDVYHLFWYGFVAGAYSLCLTWWEHRNRGAHYESYLAMTLALFTFPLALDALREEFFALLLIAVGIGMIYIGFKVRSTTVRYWGATTLVLVVLYQMRELLLGLPAWAIFGLLGIVFLAVAIRTLMTRTEDD